MAVETGDLIGVDIQSDISKPDITAFEEAFGPVQEMTEEKKSQLLNESQGLEPIINYLVSLGIDPRTVQKTGNLDSWVENVLRVEKPIVDNKHTYRSIGFYQREDK